MTYDTAETVEIEDLVAAIAERHDYFETSQCSFRDALAGGIKVRHLGVLPRNEPCSSLYCQRRIPMSLKAFADVSTQHPASARADQEVL
jgi:hypothetical protein